MYHVADNNVFETGLKTLRSVSDCDIVVCTDNVPVDLRVELTSLYGVQWHLYSEGAVTGRRAVFKVESLNEISLSYPDDTQIMAADADLYYMKDPFEAFQEYTFDLGLTSRGFRCWCDINAGVYYYRMGHRLRSFIDYSTQEIREPSWPLYVNFRKRYRHEKFGQDWTRGQDFMNVVWSHRKKVRKRFKIRVTDVTPKYNYCPALPKRPSAHDYDSLVKARRGRDISVIHLRARMKKAIYAGILPDAVTRHGKGPFNWRDHN